MGMYGNGLMSIGGSSSWCILEDSEAALESEDLKLTVKFITGYSVILVP
jgi:hypothetical protein